MAILEAVVFSASSSERLHTVNITVQASTDRKPGTMFRTLFLTLFPPREYMAKDYPYVRKKMTVASGMGSEIRLVHEKT